MGIKRGICWVLVIALLLPLFPVLSVSAVGDDGIVQEEAGSVVETEPEIVDNDASEAFPAEYDETADEDSECIVLEEENNESSNEKNIGEETEETSEIVRLRWHRRSTRRRRNMRPKSREKRSRSRLPG